MTVGVDIVAFRPAHIESLKPRLCDVHRVRAENVAPLDDLLSATLPMSVLLRTALIDGRPEAVMGMGLGTEAGHPWLLKTDIAEQRYRPLVRHCRAFIAECHRMRVLLRADVEPADEMLRHWLRWLGFREVGPSCAGRVGSDTMGIETVAIGATLLGTAVSAYGAYSQGQAQSKAADYQSAVDRNNAKLASWNSKIAEDSQSQKTEAIERAGTLRTAAQRAALGASGVDIGSGSALDVQSASTADTARAAETSAYQGALTAYGYHTQQQNFPQSGGDGERDGRQCGDGWRDRRGGLAAERGRAGGGQVVSVERPDPEAGPDWDGDVHGRALLAASGGLPAGWCWPDRRPPPNEPGQHRQKQEAGVCRLTEHRDPNALPSQKDGSRLATGDKVRYAPSHARRRSCRAQPQLHAPAHCLHVED